MIREKLKLQLLRIGIMTSGLALFSFGSSFLLTFPPRDSVLTDSAGLQIVVLILGGLVIAVCCPLLFYVNRLLAALFPENHLCERPKQALPALEPINTHLEKIIFEHSREGIMVTDARGNIVNANPAFTKVTGYTADECLGKNPRLLQSGIQSRTLAG